MNFIPDSSQIHKAPAIGVIPQSAKIVIAIDGYSGCGKSTTAKQVAVRLGYTYVDTGAMYRAVTLYFLRNGVVFTDKEAVGKALSEIAITFQFNSETGSNQTYLNGQNVEDEIRQLEVANAVPEVSAIPEVRRAMVVKQHELGRNGGIVMDGRDIGTKVFPDAQLKVFMTANSLIRAERRQAELQAKGQQVNVQEIASNLEKRDYLDTTRSESPLRQAADAQLLDTSYMTIPGQVDWVVQQAYQTIISLVAKEQPAEV